MMEREFINSLSEGQKNMLRRLLDPMRPETYYRVKYWDNGNIRVLEEYKDKKRHGVYIDFHENGMRRSHNLYVDDELEGLCRSWTDNGILLYEEQFMNGKLHGSSKVYSRDTGKLIDVYEYRHGEMVES